MALIDKGSLLMVPSTYEQEKLYNVLPSGNRAPDSTDQNSGYDQTRADFSFDRGSNAAATRVNSDGLIEKYRENVLTQSNNFSDSDWTKNRATLTGGQAGYDGSNDAWAFVDDTNNNTHLLYQPLSSIGAAVATMSVYAKAGDVDFLAFRFEGAAVDYAYFDLANGTLGTIDSDYIEARITSIGGGWYRCEATRVLAASGNQAIILPAETNNDPTYAGAGTTAVYIQNAQVETSMVATDYLDSGATRAKAGVLIDLPRINYDANGENGSLLLEPSRQQLITQSEYFGSYTPLSATITDNAATSPEGLVNAASFIETTASGRHRTQTNSFAVTSGNTYTLSIFAKIASGSRLLCLNADYLFNARAYFDLVNGDVEGTDSGSASIEDYGNGWYRCSITGTSSITGSSIAYFGLEDGANDNGYTGDGTSGHYWYGIQAEAGSYSTSYIPNHGTSGGVTRAADLCTGGGSAESINSTEGVLYWECSALNDDAGTTRVFSISDGSSTNSLYTGYNSISNLIQSQLLVNGVAQTNMTHFVNDRTEFIKVAVLYKNNDHKMYINGEEVETDTSGSVPAANTFDTFNFDLGQGSFDFYGNVKQVAVFNEALSDSELATLTTL